MSEPRDEAIVRIRDSGIGIAPEVLPHVFDLFAYPWSWSRGVLGSPSLHRCSRPREFLFRSV
jgi:hypothetical protein